MSFNVTRIPSGLLQDRVASTLASTSSSSACCTTTPVHHACRRVQLRPCSYAAVHQPQGFSGRQAAALAWVCRASSSQQSETDAPEELDGAAESFNISSVPKPQQAQQRKRRAEPGRAPRGAADAPQARAAAGGKGSSNSDSGKQQQAGRGRGPNGPSTSRNVMLDEKSPMYTPALTDEDLDQDPPGHRSGYVAVIGKPNAGKSTLINAIVGQKLSIVSAKPQTTRHRIVGIASDKDYQMILFDTPGIIEKKRNKLEERMMSAVVSSIQNAEAIVAVVDSADDPQDALAMFQPGDNWTGPPMAVLLNKSDLMTAEKLAELEAWYKTACKAEVVFTGSASNVQGVKELKEWIVSRLPEGPTLYHKSMVSEQPERFFVAELIREKIFLLYSQEVPYSTQVQIREFKERRGDKDFVSAVVVVEKDSQVGILVGKGGSALKKLGSEARTAIEAFLERKVYLELNVEVSKGWRESKQSLEQYGYFDAMYT